MISTGKQLESIMTVSTAPKTGQYGQITEKQVALVKPGNPEYFDAAWEQYQGRFTRRGCDA